jgi:[ribosomal protein S18]-alanine N-acetyltransferase
MTLPFLSPMQPEDLDEIMTLERRAFADPWSRRMYVSDLHENPLATYRVIRSAEGNGLPPILGWGGFWLLVDEAHIATIATHPDHRRQGIARKLLTYALRYMSREGAVTSFLEVRENNTAAQEMYRRFGYEAVGRRKRYYKDTDEDAILMTLKRLDSYNI